MRLVLCLLAVTLEADTVAEEEEEEERGGCWGVCVAPRLSRYSRACAENSSSETHRSKRRSCGGGNGCG